MITDYGSYADAGERHSSASSPAGCRETVILVKEPDPDLKPGDLVMHEVGHKKIPVVVREVIDVVPMHKSKLFKIFWGYPKEEAKMEKTCPQCGRMFTPVSNRQEYCSKQCRIAAADKKRLERKEALVVPEGPDDPAAVVPEETPVMLGEPEAEPMEMDMENEPKNDSPRWAEPEPQPEDKNIRAAKKILKLIPKDEAYTLKISLEADNIQINVTLIGG